jgi:hypothetical protein
LAQGRAALRVSIQWQDELDATVVQFREIAKRSVR